ncbi:radical SAM protein [Candidatus Bathyarchaeota archaeon]|nr:radical SAM protein [Candidatus Bathyarchaeota archaeon]
MVNTSVLRQSGTGFEWCINQYDGCSHGCKYCYGMAIRRKKYEDWLKVKPRKDVIPSLEKDIKKLTKNSVTIKDIFLGSITDSYQPMEYTNKLTRQIIEVLKQNELPFTILTKNDLVLRDIDLFKHYKLCRIGVTITSFDEDFRRILEPFSANYERRTKVLKTLKDAGVSTYLSCEPIFPVKEADPISIVKELKDIVDLFEFGMWNKYRTQGIPEYFYEHYSSDYYVELFRRIIEFCEEEKINYSIASHSKKLIENHRLPFKPYPLVKDQAQQPNISRQKQEEALDFVTEEVL